MVEEVVEFFTVEGEKRDEVRKQIEFHLWNDLVTAEAKPSYIGGTLAW